MDRDIESLREFIPLNTARGILPPSRAGKPVNPATIWRWVHDGVRAPDGQRVKLQAVRMGRTWLTKRAWILDFVGAISASNTDATSTVLMAAGTPSSRPPASLTAARRRAADSAQRELARLGMGA